MDTFHNSQMIKYAEIYEMWLCIQANCTTVGN